MIQIDISGLQLTNNRKITTVRAQGEYIKKNKMKRKNSQKEATNKARGFNQANKNVHKASHSFKKKERKLKAQYFEMNIMQLSSIRCKKLAMHFLQHIYNMSYVIA